MKKEKNVVSIEERIPQLKQRRKRKVNRQLIIYLTLLFILIAAVIYLQSPLSHVTKINVSGEEEVSEEVIREESGITTDTNLWSVDRAAVSDALKKHPEIREASVNRNFPSTVTISVEERERIAYVRKEEGFAPILGNGTILGVEKNRPGGDAPLLSGFKKEEDLKEMAKEIDELPESISSLISEVHWVADEEWEKVRLYMNDGYTVLASVRHFSDKMPSYPSIVAQLNPQERGIIHIGVGTYFEPFPADEEEEAGENGEEEESPGENSQVTDGEDAEQEENENQTEE